MSKEEKAKELTAMLKQLREEHVEDVERTQALLKEQNAFRKKLRQAMQGGPKTIPEIAAAAQLPANEVLWHVMAMKHYDLVREVGRDGSYYQYQLAEEEEK
jgi:predicted transcriptional regulator